MHRKSFLKSIMMSAAFMGTKPLQALAALEKELSPSTPMPLLFLGHGSPMNAIEENQFVRGFKALSNTLPPPQAILCVSAHWLTRGTKVTAMERPKTIHDFGGFPEALYQVQYPAPGSLPLAQYCKTLIQPEPLELDTTWGLDHGSWSVLKHIYPDANVPVVQLSLDTQRSATAHYELAKLFKALRHKGVLIVGSGNMIHNLALVDFKNMHLDNYGYDWAIESNAKLHQWILEGNTDALLHYEKQGEALRLAIPTPDHYWPLLYILALKEKNEKIHFFNDSLLAGSLSMTSLMIKAS